MPIKGVWATRSINSPVALDNYMQSQRHSSGARWRIDRVKGIDEAILYKFIEWRKIHAASISCRIEGNTLGAFSNDLAVLQSASTIDPTAEISFFEVDVSIPKGVMRLNAPEHSGRTYFRPIWNGAETREFIATLSDLIIRSENTPSALYPCKKLAKMIEARNGYIVPGMFVDYDSPNMPFMLSLMFGKFIKNNYLLEKRPP